MGPADLARLRLPHTGAQRKAGRRRTRTVFRLAFYIEFVKCQVCAGLTAAGVPALLRLAVSAKDIIDAVGVHNDEAFGVSDLVDATALVCLLG